MKLEKAKLKEAYCIRNLLLQPLFAQQIFLSFLINKGKNINGKCLKISKKVC